MRVVVVAGHGSCNSATGCQCEPGYAGWTCGNQVSFSPTPSASTSKPSDFKPTGNKVDGGAVAGGVIGAIVFVGVCVVLFLKKYACMCFGRDAMFLRLFNVVCVCVCLSAGMRFSCSSPPMLLLLEVLRNSPRRFRQALLRRPPQLVHLVGMELCNWNAASHSFVTREGGGILTPEIRQHRAIVCAHA